MGDGNTRNVTKLEGSFCTVEKSFDFCKYDMYCTHLRDDHHVVMMTSNEEQYRLVAVYYTVHWLSVLWVINKEKFRNI